MRNLPTKRSPKQNTIINATYDYFGVQITLKEKSEAKNIALFLMGRKSKLQPLTEEQQSDGWAIKENLKDEVYVSLLM